MTLIFIFMISFAICCGIIADVNNRDVLLGIIFGAIFGIFAVIIYLLLGEKQPE